VPGDQGIAGASSTPKSIWQYDEGHQRIKEVRTNASGTRTTWTLHPDNQGGLGFEREIAPNGVQSNRHYVSAGGSAFAVLVTTGALPTLTAAQTAPVMLTTVAAVKVEYWHKDQLGSLIATTDHAANVTGRFAYDPFGKRRYTSSTYDTFGALIVDWTTDTNTGNDRGFTGHEHLDDLGLIHMNGRVFDPLIGRFLQADPFIQAPNNLQTYDRFGYCMASPLICTDPSGYSWLSKTWHKLWRNPVVRAVIGIVVTYVTYGTASEYLAFTAQVGQTGTVIGASAISGFVGGAVTGGTFKAGIQGAFSGVLFAGVGEAIQGTSAFAGGSLGVSNPVGQVALHGVAGCIASASSGSKCGPGALSAAFSKTLAVAGATNTQNPVAGTIVSAVAGGTASVLGGGKFANGAMTGSFSYLFNELLHEGNRRTALGRSGYGETEQITVLVELPDPDAPTKLGRKGLDGHSGIAIGDDYYDYGPQAGQGANLFGSRGQPWWDLQMDGSGNADLYSLGRSSGMSGKLVYAFTVTVPVDQAVAVRTWWGNLYNNPGTYHVAFNQCTTTVAQSLTAAGIGAFDAVKPETLANQLRRAGWQESRFGR
jgi:RHS repeat-associated protein